MWYVNTMASAEEEDGNLLKFYLYARDVRSDSYFCVELHANKSEQSMTLSIKAKDEKGAVNMKKYIIDLLSVN